MESLVQDGGMNMGEILPPLSTTDLETLLASLDPRLDGFGEGPSCLDDALAYLNRLASGSRDGANTESEAEGMAQWIDIWRRAGGNRQTLRLMVQTLLVERLGRERGSEP